MFRPLVGVARLAGGLARARGAAARVRSAARMATVTGAVLPIADTRVESVPVHVVTDPASLSHSGGPAGREHGPGRLLRYGTLFDSFDAEPCRIERWPRARGGFRAVEDGLSGGDTTTEGDFELAWRGGAHHATNTGVAGGSYCFAWRSARDAAVSQLAHAGEAVRAIADVVGAGGDAPHDAGLYGAAGAPAASPRRSNEARAQSAAAYLRVATQRLAQLDGAGGADSSDAGPRSAAYFCTEINYHACGSQLFYSDAGAMLLLLALPPRDRAPDAVLPEDFEAFVVPPGCGVNVDAMVWCVALPC